MSPWAKISIVLTAFGTVGWALSATALAHRVLAINDRQCQQYIDAAGDKGADYAPGVDARGRAVATADVGRNPQIDVPSSINLDITVDIRRAGKASGNRRAHTYFEGAGGQAYGADAVVAEVSVVDGRLYVNGQPLGDPETAAIAEACDAYVSSEVAEQ